MNKFYVWDTKHKDGPLFNTRVYRYDTLTDRVYRYNEVNKEVCIGIKRGINDFALIPLTLVYLINQPNYEEWCYKTYIKEFLETQC